MDIFITFHTEMKRLFCEPKNEYILSVSLKTLYCKDLIMLQKRCQFEERFNAVDIQVFDIYSIHKTLRNHEKEVSKAKKGEKVSCDEVS